MITDNLKRVQERIEKAAARAGRSAEDITLVTVTKERSLAEIEEVIAAGAQVIGENRVQEAKRKYPHLEGRVALHMIGHLQRNKVQEALRMFDMVHSVDSLRLAREITKEAVKSGIVVPVLLEVNVSGEESKYGLVPAEIRAVLEQVAGMPGLRVEGLMTMAPWCEDPETARPIFRGLRLLAEEAEEWNLPNVQMRHLSMGMTQDFEVAVEEGATMVRVGTAIFGGKRGKVL